MTYESERVAISLLQILVSYISIFDVRAATKKTAKCERHARETRGMNIESDEDEWSNP